MKRFVLVTFISTLLALVLQSLSIVYFQTKPDIPSTDNSLSFSITKRPISLDRPVVDIIIENTSNDEATYGSLWVIEKLVNEK